MKTRKIFFSIVVLCVCLLCGCAKKSIEVRGVYSAYLDGYDWGESISRVTLKLDEKATVFCTVL